MIKPCAICKTAFKPRPFQIKNRTYYCPPCNSAKAVEWAKNNPAKKYAQNKKYFKAHPEIQAERQKRYRTKYPDKFKARWAIQNEVRSGRMNRGNCESCGDIKSEAHHDDYSKPLMVRWLCKAHHDDVTNRAMLEARKASK